ncbi:MAG: Asp-tRNA(Asn)/Glu-tRNA(Gln) amidotransferase subunit GatB [Patescibacteria group bacterium]|nr:Asp-tRNA(Asn)/Glu-tRNA(Gln) amidotransferase subunit GatB [Patescibacteria group bacterium]
MTKYETVIGLEIHIQLKTKSKMFCRCDNFSVKAEPNTNICPVCLGMPGTLPKANKKAIEWLYLLGIALNGKIRDGFQFERKNYYYPDLPKAYQITSSTDKPVDGGFLELEIDRETRKVELDHIHLEEDAGKLVHGGDDYSLVDLNRAGTPLIELVTKPDIRSPKEAKTFVQRLRAIVRYLGISYANMEEGNLRCDANISLRKAGGKLGEKVEIKNLNSFKMLERALEYEEKRQSEILELNKKIIQETRGWDDAKGKTLPQRLKEETQDYRYFPEPDLPPILVGKTEKNGEFLIGEIKNKLPELPAEKEKRFEKEYGLSRADAKILTAEIEIARFFEQTVGAIEETDKSAEEMRRYAKKAANWILTELFYKMKEKDEDITKIKIIPFHLASLIDLIESGQISGKIAKEIFNEMYETGKEPENIIKEKGLEQITGLEELEKIIKEVISNNPKSVEDYKKGKEAALGYLVGQVMKETKGKANPQAVNEILKQKLV